MTLRARMLLGWVSIAVVLVVGGFVTSHLQRSFLLDAIDERIERITSAPRFIEKRVDGANLGKPGGIGLSGTFLGLLNPAGGPASTISAPDDDPNFVPDVSRLTVGDDPSTVNATSGEARSARAALVQLPDSRVVVVSIPLTATNRASARLDTTLFLVVAGLLTAMTLMTVWIVVFGVKPIRELTIAAAKVADGESPDVSSVPTATHEATELKKAINDLIARAKQNEERMRRFVSDASHELRTPLTTLRGYSSLLTSDTSLSPEKLNDSLTRINEESLRMSRLVDDLLTLARSEEVRAVDLGRFDLAMLTEDLAADLRVIQPERTISVSTPERHEITADRTLVTQAVLALTTNAIKHTPVDTPIEIVVTDEGTYTRVKVTDAGPGIDPAHIPFLFDRFYRVSTSSSHHGAGLGLAIVASIVERHGGNVGVESNEGSGATFWFDLPTNPPKPSSS